MNIFAPIFSEFLFGPPPFLFSGIPLCVTNCPCVLAAAGTCEHMLQHIMWPPRLLGAQPLYNVRVFRIGSQALLKRLATHLVACALAHSPFGPAPASAYELVSFVRGGLDCFSIDVLPN